MNGSRLIEFLQKEVQNPVKLIGHFHHGCMTAFIDEMQLTVWYEPVEFPANKWWGHCIIVSPDQ